MVLNKKDIISYAIKYFFLALILVPINIIVGGKLYPSGKLNEQLVLVYFLVFVIIVFYLYQTKPLYGFMLCSLVAMTNYFSLIPSWVYKIVGVIRIDDFCLISTLLYISFSGKTLTKVKRFKSSFFLIIIYVLFILIYTIVYSGELPWLALREIRPYIHYFWYFVPPYFIKNEEDVNLYIKFIILGTIGNSLLYIPQVLFKISLGYVDTGYYTSMANEGFRVWQGSPDLLFIAIVLIAYFLINRRKKVIFLSIMLILIFCLFSSGWRAWMIAYSLGIFVAILLYYQSNRSSFIKPLAVILFIVIIGSIAIKLASNLLGVENIVTARFDYTKLGSDMVFQDRNLLVRLLLLNDTIDALNLHNPLLGFGFLSAGSDATKRAGIQYFGEYQIRNNDIGVATILGQGGYLFVLIQLVFVIVVSRKLYIFSKNDINQFNKMLYISVICFMLCQIPLSVVNFGFTSTQVISSISILVSISELLYTRFVNY